jgi:hypothetical protein
VPGVLITVQYGCLQVDRRGVRAMAFREVAVSEIHEVLRAGCPARSMAVIYPRRQAAD